ncbi:MAG: SRPBCC family protein [Actinomycetota bacterium]
MAFRNEIHTEAAIEGTADEVWAVLSDFGSYGEWNPGMEEVEGEPTVGSRLTIRFALNGGRTMTMRPTVQVADPGRELRWLGRLLMPGLFDGEHRLMIEEREPGRVTFLQSERFRGLLVPFLRTMIEVDTVATFRAVNEALARRVAEQRTRTA